MIVYSIADVDSFKSAEKIFNSIRAVKEYENFAVTLVGAKSDLCGLQRAVTYEQGQHLAGKLGASFLECSALSGVGVYEVFLSLCNTMRKLYFEKENRILEQQEQEYRRKKEEVAQMMHDILLGPSTFSSSQSLC